MIENDIIVTIHWKNKKKTILEYSTLDLAMLDSYFYIRKKEHNIKKIEFNNTKK